MSNAAVPKRVGGKLGKIIYRSNNPDLGELVRIVAGPIWQGSNNRRGIEFVMKYIHINPEAGNGGEIILSVKG